jgi:hypothetical protein
VPATGTPPPTSPQGPAAAPNGKNKYVPPAGKLYRAIDDPALKHLIGLGSPEDNRRFETEAGILYRAKGETDNPKLIESRTWFKEEKRRRQEIWNKQQAAGPAATTNQAPAAQGNIPPAPTPAQQKPETTGAGKKMRGAGKGLNLAKQVGGKAKAQRGKKS